jgi:hypothetical protein
MNTPELRLDAIGDRQARRGLCLEVPGFQKGPLPPPWGSWEPLYPRYDHEGDLPVFWDESLMASLRHEEAEFRRRHRTDWIERCWFIHGHLQRAPHGELWARVARTLPALSLIQASAAGFEFSAETWSHQRTEAEKAGEILLGWIHTHSLEYLGQAERGCRGEGNAAQGNPSVCDSRSVDLSAESGPDTGLFLSPRDAESAYRLGFSAAYQITCVLDSDACIRPGKRLSEVLGAWGWSGCLLCRRSVHVVRDNDCAHGERGTWDGRGGRAA